MRSAPCLALVGLIGLLAPVSAGAAPVSVASPNGRVVIVIEVGDAGHLVWRATLDGKPAIDLSPMGIIWDETKVLAPSEIGEVAIFARRRGDRWFVAAMNGSQARTVNVDLSFLGAGTHQAVLVRDKADDPAAVEVETREVVRERPLTIDMRVGGGFVLRVTK